MMKIRLRHALKFAGGHFLASVLVAALAAILVFGVWFPYPYRDLVGGRDLFLLIVSVDVVCGPLLTLVMFNHLKSRRELMFDLGLVVCIQLAALLYGLWTVTQARPVYLAFEVDRFRAVTYADIQHSALNHDKGGLHRLGWGRPKVIGVRQPANSQEMLQSLDLSLGGVDPAFRPDWWVPYESVKERVLSKAQPIAALEAKKPNELKLIQRAVIESGRSAEQLLWLPVTSFQSSGWVVFIGKDDAVPLSFAPIDGF